jgi:hypothetical protein
VNEATIEMQFQVAGRLTELRAEVASLHDELAMARVEAQETCVAQPAESQASEALSATRYGVWKPTGGPVRWRSELE